MVEFKDVSVTYSSGVDALNKVNLKINDGDFAFVVGPSGAGKSTLIKLVLKEIDATSGTVMVNGFNLKKLRRRKKKRLKLKPRKSLNLKWVKQRLLASKIL